MCVSTPICSCGHGECASHLCIMYCFVDTSDINKHLCTIKWLNAVLNVCVVCMCVLTCSVYVQTLSLNPCQHSIEPLLHDKSLLSRPL